MPGAWRKFVAHVEEKLGRKLTKVPAEAIAPRPAFDRSAHIGVHTQKQAGLNWIGVVLPVGTAHRAHRCAAWPRSRAISATAISA